MDKRVEQLRNEAFWMTFISENFASATYGRPNMIDEMDCDVDVPTIPSGYQPLDERTRLQNFLVQEDESKFRILDTALGNWFHNLPSWLKFEEMMEDPNRTLLNGIG
ncbi:10881_t:CDS:2, partial [Acaulospora colombiana]